MLPDNGFTYLIAGLIRAWMRKQSLQCLCYQSGLHRRQEKRPDPPLNPGIIFLYPAILSYRNNCDTRFPLPKKEAIKQQIGALKPSEIPGLSLAVTVEK